MSKNNIKSTVEQEKNGVVATTYVKDTDKMIAGKEEEKGDCFEVSILKKLKNLITFDNLEDMVTSKYIIEKLGLKGQEEEQVKHSPFFDICRFKLKNIKREIETARKATESVLYTFSTEEDQTHFVDERSAIETDVAKGMICIMPMVSWGVDGGVYAIKILSDTERKSEIKLMLKYMDEELGEYAYSEYVTVKLSDLVYKCEGTDALKKNLGKLKKLMEYTPAKKEELNHQKLYVALCHFHEKITTRVVESDKLNFNDTYRILVREVYELKNEHIFGNGYYILNSSELTKIAKKAGYTCNELASMLKERGFLETDKDKIGRRKKTVTRDGVKTKYYCIRTSERFHELCDAMQDKLSLTEDDYKSLDDKYSELMGLSEPKQVEDKSEKAETDNSKKEKPKKSKKVTQAW
ncbi:hypothetical protein KQI61_10985 [Anaerocolumna aminovalerica]|uniref:hypothetical protein n=1 Tax=Anaerocolumna aminovalerica TaxID=1527 RepID=UPI001C0EE10E|nr:hypothetical protein [Anaerocolumna aminovalerica]MBU5332728.1 hypothetical protein [Anaerocolumna aminovalerica]